MAGAKRPALRGLLEIDGVTVRFGGVTALDGVSIRVAPCSVHAIIGPNGAGKTSALNCISGVYRPQAGSVLMEGRDITRMPPYARARLGIARTFQNIALFKGMSVLDNLLVGRHAHQDAGILAGALYYGKAEREEMSSLRLVEGIIDLLEIQKIRKQIVGTLAYGLQKRVELARALAMEPRVLLLDEPMAGMNAEEKEDMARFIIDINRERSVTVVMIEHDMGVVMDISDRVTVLDFGKRIAEGPPERIQADGEVQQAYLGRRSA